MGARWRILVAALVLAAGACVSESDPEPAASRPAPALDGSEYDGLTPEELRLQAEPMTLEEAERLGIVDTTIHIEYPMSPESIPLMPDPPGSN